MQNASPEARQQIEDALAKVCEPFLQEQLSPENVERLRVAAFDALFELAMQRIIPPEITLAVSAYPIVSEKTVRLDFSRDFKEWMGYPEHASDAILRPA